MVSQGFVLGLIHFRFSRLPSSTLKCLQCNQNAAVLMGSSQWDQISPNFIFSFLMIKLRHVLKTSYPNRALCSLSAGLLLGPRHSKSRMRGNLLIAKSVDCLKSEAGSWPYYLKCPEMTYVVIWCNINKTEKEWNILTGF